MAKCFKCEKEIQAAWQINNSEDVWEGPCGVLFEGGWNFGSSIYDAFVDGVTVEIIICDECIAAAQNTDRLKEKNEHRKR